MEKLVEEISFTASERSGETIAITAQNVRTRVGELGKNADLSKFICEHVLARAAGRVDLSSAEGNAPGGAARSPSPSRRFRVGSLPLPQAGEGCSAATSPLPRRGRGRVRAT